MYEVQWWKDRVVGCMRLEHEWWKDRVVGCTRLEHELHRPPGMRFAG